MFSQDRKQLRKFYLSAWGKFKSGIPLEPLEMQVVDVIKAHPEYHTVIEQGEDIIDQDFSPQGAQTNPFLHMGFHLGIRDQISTNLPTGIRSVAEKLLLQLGDKHAAEHQMMECLVEAVWQMQRHQAIFDESAYMACLKKL